MTLQRSHGVKPSATIDKVGRRIFRSGVIPDSINDAAFATGIFQ